jgi:hypothetical protein
LARVPGLLVLLLRLPPQVPPLLRLRGPLGPMPLLGPMPPLGQNFPSPPERREKLGLKNFLEPWQSLAEEN